MSNPNQLNAPISIPVIEMQQTQESIHVRHGRPEITASDTAGHQADGHELQLGPLVDVIRASHTATMGYTTRHGSVH